MHALGLVDASHTLPLSATIHWVLKDGFGMLGGILYTSFVHTRFDAEPQKHRFRASVLMQVAGGLELTTALFPSYFVLIASTCNISACFAVCRSLLLYLIHT